MNSAGRWSVDVKRIADTDCRATGPNGDRNVLGDDFVFNEPPFFWSQNTTPINLTGYAEGFDEKQVVGSANARDVLLGFRENEPS
jgi:hypothetical protein